MKVFAVGLILSCVGAVYGQRNNPFAANPGKSSPGAPVAAKTTPDVFPIRTKIGERTYNIAADAAKRSLKPTDMYKVGPGDVLHIAVSGAAADSYTVSGDGTIDFPLAGGIRVVEGKTLDEIEQDLVSNIAIIPDAVVTARVGEYGSHKVTVTGLVADGGDRSLQREALPLFVIKAYAGVAPTATGVVITRPGSLKPDTYDLHDPATDDVLVYPGTTIEFLGEAAPTRK